MTFDAFIPDGDVTFNEQSEVWLDSLKTRKRKPVSPATLHAFSSYMRRLTPMIGDTKLTDLNNGLLKQLVQRLDKEKLGAKTINELVFVVKQVHASLVDQNTGEPIFKREWSARFIDCPTVTKQKQPCVTAKDIERCLEESTNDKEKLLYAVLAGAGLRIAEGLAIHVRGTEEQTAWDQERQAIRVRSSIFKGRELSRLKTAAARRTVDLDPRLNDLIAQYVETNGIKAGDYLFQSRSGPGRPMHVNTARHWLADRGVPGFHSFRRFFISRRRSIGFPEFLLRSLVGHSGKSMTDLYDKSAENEAFRKYWAEKAGLGFELPELRPQNRETTASFPDPIEAKTPVEEVMRYEAADCDLPLELFQAQPSTESQVEVE